MGAGASHHGEGISCCRPMEARGNRGGASAGEEEDGAKNHNAPSPLPQNSQWCGGGSKSHAKLG